MGSYIWTGGSHLIDYLRVSDENRRVCPYVEADIRFVCSGLLIRANCDRKSPFARLLLEQPIKLFALTGGFWGSAPSRDHQELSCRLCVPELRDEGGKFSTTYYPVDNIATDLAAVLTLFLRRLVSFATVVGEQQSEDPNSAIPPELRYVAMPIASAQDARVWPRHPIVNRFYPDSRTVIDYNPAPIQVNPSELSDLFHRLCRSDCAERFVWAARLYANAMSLIHEFSDVSYLLLTQAVEALAEKSISLPKPKEAPPNFISEATNRGVPEPTARELYALAHVKENAPTHQFREYLTKFIPDTVWNQTDDLWPVEAANHLSPTKNTLDTAIRAIYSQRSKYTHTGRPYQPSINVGLGPLISAEAMLESVRTSKVGQVPPVTWFERAAHGAILQHLRLSTSGNRSPTT